MTHEVSIPLWALFAFSGALILVLLAFGFFLLRHSEATKDEFLNRYTRGYEAGMKAGVPQGMLQVGPQNPDRYREGYSAAVQLLNKSEEAYEKGYNAGQHLGEQMGRAKVRVFTGSETNIENKFFGSRTMIVHHAVVKFGDEVVFSSINLKNTTKEKLDNMLKEVVTAAGTIAAAGLGDPTTAVAAMGIKLITPNGSNSDSEAA